MDVEPPLDSANTDTRPNGANDADVVPDELQLVPTPSADTNELASIPQRDTANSDDANTDAGTDPPTLVIDELPKPPPASLMPRRRGHRAQSGVWRLLTAEEKPHKSIASTCMHCGSAVPHHHKSEKARAHLKRCTAFHRFVAARGDAMQAQDWLDDARDVVPIMDRELGLNDDLVSRRQQLADPTPTKRAKSKPAALPNLDAVVDALAMYIYTSGVPFNHVHDPHLMRAFRLCLPPPHSVTPTVQDLHGPLLDRCVAAVQSELVRRLEEQPDAVNTLCMNSWYRTNDTTDQQQPRTLQSLGNDRDTLFVDSTAVVDESDAAAHLFVDTMTKALALTHHVHAIVTDNSHANQLMWTKFKATSPSLFIHGCASHGLHLFINQIFGNAGDDDEGIPTPFADLRQLVLDCRELVAYFTQPSLDRSADVANDLHKSGRQPLLFPPLSGRWRGLKSGLETVLHALPTLVNASLDAPTRIRELLGQSHLTPLLLKAIALLEPLDALLTTLEHDPHVPISDVFYWFAKHLPMALSRVHGLSDIESAFLMKLNQIRFNAMYGDSHGMAYLLDPRYVGEGLSVDVRKNIEDQVFLTPLLLDTTSASPDANLDELKIRIAQELTEYVIDATKEKTSLSFRYLMLAKQKKSVVQYWQTDGVQWPHLQRLATRLFRLPASSVPMTRRVLQVPLRTPADPIPAEAARKIAFIQRNHALLQGAAQ